MSIILSMISKKGGVVCSDGRKFSSIIIKEDDTSDEKATIASDNYDKTFNIQKKLIGAYCGLLSFSSHNIQEHIADLVKDKLNVNHEEIIAIIENGLRDKLLQISHDEIRLKSRKIDLLLVGRKDKKRMQISALSFFPQESTILSIKETVITNSENRYYTFGDDNAQRSAKNILNQNKAPNFDNSYLIKLSKKAISAGINYSSRHPYSDEQSCGGDIFFRQI